MPEEKNDLDISILQFFKMIKSKNSATTIEGLTVSTSSFDLVHAQLLY